MEIFKTLENVSTKELVDVFNLSFSDYLIPLSLTEELLINKMKSESIQPELSVGAFVNDRLVGFILHGFDEIGGEKVVFNGGTGVIPANRGKRLTVRMYEFIMPLLHEKKIDKVRLEVIKENQKALRTYKKIGFTTIRELNCYKGSIGTKNMGNHYTVKSLQKLDWEYLRTFWDIDPAWQCSARSIENLKEINVSFGIYEKDSLIGYLVYNPKTRRVGQFAVHKDHRNKGVATTLFQYAASNYSNEMVIINVDENSERTNGFLTTLGLDAFISQYEMQLSLK